MSAKDSLLLFQNAEVTKQVSVARQAQVDLEREKKELADSFARVSDQAQRKVSQRDTWGCRREWCVRVCVHACKIMHVEVSLGLGSFLVPCGSGR